MFGIKPPCHSSITKINQTKYFIETISLVLTVKFTEIRNEILNRICLQTSKIPIFLKIKAQNTPLLPLLLGISPL